MKKFMFLLLVGIFCVVSSLAFAGRTTVRGYYRKDGTYVRPHSRTTPNSSRMDNYSYPGNYNPNTGDLTPRSTSPKQTWPSNPNPYDNDYYDNNYR